MPKDFKKPSKNQAKEKIHEPKKPNPHIPKKENQSVFQNSYNQFTLTNQDFQKKNRVPIRFPNCNPHKELKVEDL